MLPERMKVVHGLEELRRLGTLVQWVYPIGTSWCILHVEISI
jgi:hypothetical protein